MEQASSSHLDFANTNPPSSAGEDFDAKRADITSTAESSSLSFMGDFAEATHDLLMDEFAARRAAAAHRLAELGNPLASPYLIAALCDNSWEVRQAAVEALGHISESEAIKPLQDLLDRGNQDVLLQRAISRAIQSISARAAKAPATPVLTAPVIDTSREEFSPLDQDVFPPNGGAGVKHIASDAEWLRLEAKKLDDDEKIRLAAIEANRNSALTEARHRNEKERLLASEIEALRQAESDQVKRIQEAKAASRRRYEEEARQQAETEAQEHAAAEARRLAELEAARREAEAEVQERAQQDGQLAAAIGLLRQAEAEQVERIKKAEAVLQELEQSLQDRKSTRLNSSHLKLSRMPSSA